MTTTEMSSFDGLIRRMELLLLACATPPAELPPEQPRVVKARRVRPENYQPQPRTHWYCIRWDAALGQFDRNTLRREVLDKPGITNPRFQHRPFVFPWVYIPAKPNIVFLTKKTLPDYVPSEERVISAAVDWLNEVCTWQTHVTEMADCVAELGGCLIQWANGGIVPDHVPPLRFRKRLGGKPRNATRASEKPHTGLREAIRRERLKRVQRRDDIDDPALAEITRHKTRPFQATLKPVAASHRKQKPYQWTRDDVERYCQLRGLTETDLAELLDLLGI